MQIHELTALARQMKASDIHISQGLPLMFRIDGKLVEAPVQFDEDATRALIENTLQIPGITIYRLQTICAYYSRSARASALRGLRPARRRPWPSPRRTAPAAV